MRRMSFGFLAALVFTAAESPAFSLPSPETGVFADTECATNAPPWHASCSANGFSAVLSLTATPTDCVELLFAEESDRGCANALSFGWDVGSWFLRNGSWRRDFPSASDDPAKSIAVSIRMDADGRPVSLSVEENGVPVALPDGVAEELGVFPRLWDTALVIRRGFGPPDEVSSARFTADPSSMIFR